jgi:hypothetical protein
MENIINKETAYYSPSRGFGGKNKPDPIIDILPIFQRFYRENGRYPTGVDINKTDYFPSTKFFDRHFGGLLATRRLLGLEVTDLRCDSSRTTSAHFAISRSYDNEQHVHKYLTTLFGKQCVHREAHIEDTFSRYDFFIYSNKGDFAVDVFFPKDKQSFWGCLNVKLKKYSSLMKTPYTLLLYQMNPSISQSDVDSWVANKKNKLPKNFLVVCKTSFEDYCLNHK